MGCISVASAFAWVSDLFVFFSQFFPRPLVIRSTEGGVKFKNGHTPVEMKPGLNVWFPFRSEVITYPIALQSVDLKAQTLHTTDDRTIIAAGVLEYRVTDIMALLTNVFNADITIQNIAYGAFATVLSNRSWEDLKKLKSTGELERIIRREARKRLRRYGIKVIRTTLTDFAPVRVYKLFQATSVDG